MKLPLMASLHTAIAIALASASAHAQQDPEQPSEITPGLYATVNESEIYIIQGDEQIDLKVGETAFVGQDGMRQLDVVPAFLNWPCGDSGGQGQGQSGLMPTYPLESLPAGNRVEEIVRRFFEGPEIPANSPAWLNGEAHGSFPADEISKFSTSAYWYESGMTTPKMDALRPNILLISLYPATQQVVVDQNHFQELRDLYGSKDIPVTFVFNEEYIVPVSYFGKNVTLQQVADAYFEKGITIADVPIWYAGDRQLTASPAELERLFDIPAIEDIDPDRLAALIADLQANGFTRKPINVSLMSQNDTMAVDDGEKVRAAQSIGMDSLPIVVFSYNEESHRKLCRMRMPQFSMGGEVGEGSASTPDVGVPPTEPVLPPEETASGN
jgi:hypothetical protein